MPDLQTLNGILSDLQSRCGSVEVRQLVRSTSDEETELLFVDRSAFTDRQYDIVDSRLTFVDPESPTSSERAFPVRCRWRS